MKRRQRHQFVPVHHLSSTVHRQHPVAVAVERESHGVTPLEDPLRQFVDVR